MTIEEVGKFFHSPSEIDEDKGVILKVIHYLTLVWFALLLYGCLGNDDRLKARPSVRNTEGDLKAGTPTPSPSATGTPTETRPTGLVYVDKGFCGCLKGKPDTLNNCEQFCQSKTVEAPTLYGKVYLAAEVELTFGNLQTWCGKQINDGKINPKCQLEIYDGSEVKNIEVTITGNSFTANIASLDKNKTYIAATVETGSGSGARTQSFQLRRTDFDSSLDNDGPLKLVPIHMYSCSYRAGVPDPDLGNKYDNSYRDYYFYPDSTKPPTMPPGQGITFCHDIEDYGSEDNSNYPRLELRENIFTMWSENDVRFYDLNSNKKLDVNDYIQEKLQREYGITSDINIFSELVWPNAPAVAYDSGTPAPAPAGSPSSSSSGTIPRLGYIMTSWINPVTKKPYCLTQENYNSPAANPIFKILRDLVGVDTEAIYMGTSVDRKPMTDENGNTISAPDVRILIRESIIKKIWFYVDGGRAVKPDENAIATKPLYFYWPFEYSSPYIQKSSQTKFVIKNEQNSSSGMRNSVTPSDRRIGCIPSIGSN